MGMKEVTLREIRINPVVPTESVLVATERNMRPKKAETPAPKSSKAHVDTCPFCRGNESRTPPAIQSIPDAKNWEVRIVENLYPILGDDKQNPDFAFGLQQTIDGYGRHEVIIDHSNHGITLDEMSPEHITLLFTAYKERLISLYASDPRLKYILVFKNFGPAAGGSIPHTHSQIIAMPVVPHNVQQEIEYSYQYFNKQNHCIFCTLIDEALTYEATIYDRESGEVHRKIDVGQYIIEKSQHFIAIKPFASRYEWEMHILPLTHQMNFLECTTEALNDFSQLLKHTMQRLEAVLGGVQYNYFLHTIPNGKEYEKYSDSYHWYLEICPRTSVPTGFELGSGLFVNSISPEDAAKKLREIEI